MTRRLANGIVVKPENHQSQLIRNAGSLVRKASSRLEAQTIEELSVRHNGGIDGASMEILGNSMLDLD